MAVKEGSMLKIDDFEARKNHVQETKEHETEDEKGFNKSKQLFRNFFWFFMQFWELQVKIKVWSSHKWKRYQKST